MKQSHIEYDLHPVYDTIRKIEAKVLEEIDDVVPAVKSRVTMTITELLENAIKYGESTKQYRDIHFDFTTDQKKLTIKVTNAVLNQDHFTSCAKHIDKINKSNNPKRLYLQRLQDLIEQENPFISQLGLYRIAYEGKFKLSYDFIDNLLTITAIYVF